ncbi:5374_t:CDS:2, partial [Ambispora gerdemannii]
AIWKIGTFYTMVDVVFVDNNINDIVSFEVVYKDTVLQVTLDLSAQHEETVTLPSTITYFPLKENPEFVEKIFSVYISIEVETYIHEIYTERR